jgi:hypothetical protein
MPGTIRQQANGCVVEKKTSSRPQIDEIQNEQSTTCLPAAWRTGCIGSLLLTTHGKPRLEVCDVLPLMASLQCSVRIAGLAPLSIPRKLLEWPVGFGDEAGTISR